MALSSKLRHGGTTQAMWLLCVLLWGVVPCLLGDSCCEDDIFMQDEMQCHNYTEKILALNCSKTGIFMLDPIHEVKDTFEILPNGHLQILEYDQIIDTGRFCTTRLQYKDGTLSALDIALVCFEDQDNPDVQTKRRMIAYGVCLCVSTAFLLATLLVYWVLPELRDLQGKSIMGMILALLLGYLWLAIMQLSPAIDGPACNVHAFLLYFWMLSAFFWINVVSFNLWRNVIFHHYRVNEEHLFVYYCIYGWGSPLVFLTAALLTEHMPGDHIRPNFGIEKCWFDGPAETWTFFYGPVAVLLFCNLVFFLWTTCRLWKECNDVSVRHLRSMRFKCMLYMKLFLVMGVTWIFEVLSFAIENGSWYWIVTDILNSLQGVIIFFLVVCRKRVLRAVTRNKPCGFSCPNQWTAGLDEESETMLAGETELNPTNRSFLGRV